MEGVEADQIPFSAGLAYWQYNMLSVLSLTQTSQLKMFIAFDQLINDPDRVCTNLHRFLNEQCRRQPMDADRETQALVSQVTASEYHYHESRSLAEVEQATREQRALYNFLRLKTLYPGEAFNQEDFALYPGWREYLRTMDTLLTSMQET